MGERDGGGSSWAWEKGFGRERERERERNGSVFKNMRKRSWEDILRIIGVLIRKNLFFQKRECVHYEKWAHYEIWCAPLGLPKTN